MTENREWIIQSLRVRFNVWNTEGPRFDMIQALTDIALRASARGRVTEQDVDQASRIVYATYNWRESWDTLLHRMNEDDGTKFDAYRAEVVHALLENAL